MVCLVEVLGRLIGERVVLSRKILLGTEEG